VEVCRIEYIPGAIRFVRCEQRANVNVASIASIIPSWHSGAFERGEKVVRAAGRKSQCQKINLCTIGSRVCYEGPTKANGPTADC